MKVRVISLEGCDGAVKTTALIKNTAKKLGLVLEPEIIIVKTIEEACKYRHIGGPTVQIDGLDIEPEARKLEQFAIT